MPVVAIAGLTRATVSGVVVQKPSGGYELVDDPLDLVVKKADDATSSDFAGEDGLHGVHCRVENGHGALSAVCIWKIDQQDGLCKLDSMLHRGFVGVDQLTLVTDRVSVTKHF